MEQQDLDRLAYAGAELPDRLGYADTLYFLMLRALYRYAKQTDMPPEQGQREKAKVLEAVRTFRTDERRAAARALQFRDTGAARAEFRQALLLGNIGDALRVAERIVEALDNIPIERKENGLVRSTPNNDKAPENAEAGASAES